MTTQTYTAREQLERLARWTLDGRTLDCCLSCTIKELAPHSPADRVHLFKQLVEAVELRDRHGAGQQGVDEALDALTGGAQ